MTSPPHPRPLPAGFRLVFDPALRRPHPGVLIGGSPLRVLKLTAAGAGLVGRWAAGEPVGASAGARALAARLVDAGLAHPRPAAAPSLPGAAVVIPVRDDPDGLAATLDALAATAPGVPVWVIDDGSAPALPPPPHAGVRLLRRDSPGGPAAARNTGWRAAAGADVIVFVDAGCVLEAGWPEALLGHFADPGLAAVAPRVASRAAAGTPRGLAAHEEAHSPLDMGPAEGPVRPGAAVPYVPTAVLAVRRSALEPGFDEDLRFGEDVDLVWRLGGAGWRVRYDPSVRATHPVRATRGRWLRQRFDYGRSAAPLAARHGRAVAPLSVNPWSAAVWAFLAAGRPVPAAVLAVGSAAALTRRAGRDRATAAELGRLALSGHARAGGPIAGAVRRAWLPPAAVAAGLAWRLGDRRARRALAVAAAATIAGDGARDWWTRRPPVDPLRWVLWRVGDDLAYQAGVWAGVARNRSAAALLPRW